MRDETAKRANFFILGAPKCGTTSLAQWLSENPAVYVSPVKEPHFFSTDLGNRNVKSQHEYDRLFSEVRPSHIAVGEASTWYLYSRDALAKILAYNPEAKFIIMSRDPVEMAISLHHHNHRKMNEDEPDFMRAWNLQAARREGKSIPWACREPAFLQYLAACSLGEQVGRLLGRVEPSRILHISLESMQENPRQEYLRVLGFLGVPDDGRQSFPVANQARGRRSLALQAMIRLGVRLKRSIGLHRGWGLARFNEREQEKTEMPEADKKRIAGAFEADLALLHSHLERLRPSSTASLKP